MLRRVACAAVVAVIAGVVTPAVQASAADIGVISYESVANTSATSAFARKAYDRQVLSAEVMSDGGITIVDSDPGNAFLRILLPGGAQPQPGSTYQLGGGTTRGRITGKCGVVGPGLLRVDDVAYSGSQVTLLKASFGVLCAANGAQGGYSQWLTGSIGIGATPPPPSPRPAPAAAATTGRSRPSPVTVRIVNDGSAATSTLGAAGFEPYIPGAQDFTITQDGCAGVVLDPGQACEIALTFQRSTAGGSTALVVVPDSGADGGQIVAPVSGTAVAAPAAPAKVATFPVTGGAIGIAWDDPSQSYSPTSYRVERDEGGTWVDASGSLPGTARSWLDTSVAAGTSAHYRVIAENPDGPSAPSATVTGSRAEHEAELGSVDAITVDADLGGRAPALGEWEGVRTDVSAGPGARGPSGTKSLQAPGLSISLPALLPGPGTYAVDGTPSSPAAGFGVPMSSPGGCSTVTGVLTVHEVAFTADQDLATLAASYRLACPDGIPVFGELRWKSTMPFAALTVAPARTDLGRVPLGQQSSPTQVTITNAGTIAQALGQPTFAGDRAADWTLSDNTCPAVLAAGQSCAVTAVASPSASGPHPATLAVPDATARGVHHATLAVTGTSLPSPASRVKAIRVPSGGVDLSWGQPADNGGTGIQRYVVHRHTSAGEQTFDVAYAEPGLWADPEAPADAQYAVSVVNEIGEGSAGDAIAPTSRTESLYVTVSPRYPESFPALIALPDGAQPVALPLRGGQEGQAYGFTVSPDGRTVASTLGGNGSYTLWREPVDRSGPPVLLLTSPTPLGRPVWSPDGSAIALSEPNATPRGPAIQVVPASGGSPTLTLSDLDSPEWLPDSRTLVVRDLTANGSPLAKISAATGARLGAIPGTEDADLPTVSPDGRWLAFYRAYGAGGTFVMPLDGGPAKQIPNANVTQDMSWSPDGTTLAISTMPTYHGPAGIYLSTIAASGVPSAAEMLDVRLSTSRGAVAWAGPRVAIGPTPALLGPATAIRLDASTLPAGAALSCTVDARPAAPCGASFVPGALPTGQHLIRVRSVEPDGRVTVAARTVTSDSTPPVARLLAPTILATTAASVTTSFSATDASGVASYDVRYRRAGGNGVFGAYVTAVSATRSTTATVALAAGYQYCLSVRARDAVGNVSAWTAERCLAKPLDDRSLALATRGWTRTTGAGLYNATSTLTRTKGAALTLGVVSARRLYVVATTAPACGTLAVYLGNTRVGTLSLYSPHRRLQALLPVVLTARRSGTVRLVVISPSGCQVQVDGLGVLAS